MMVRIRVSLGLLTLLLAGCASNANVPLVFMQAQSVGITANTGTTQQSAELTLGYRDVDAALIPVTIGQADGSATRIKAIITDDDAKKGKFSEDDALSVLGQFKVDTETKNPSVGLGKFFATGIAAKRLADGFAHQLGDTKKAATTQ